MKDQIVFITGHSRGLGRGLTDEYIARGWQVLGLSRRGLEDAPGQVLDLRCDLSQLDTIAPALEEILAPVAQIDLVILNAGVLGEIRELSRTPLDEMQRVMNVNVWANKVILDWLLNSEISVDQIVAISSGASVNGNKGWGAYALSKAALNMLIKLYAHEFPTTHLSAFAPGLIHTAMQDYLCNEVNTALYPSIQTLKSALNTPRMPEPRQAAHDIAKAFDRLRAYPSGSYVDLRAM